MTDVIGFAYEDGVLYTRVKGNEHGETQLIPNEILSRVITKQAEKMDMPPSQLVMILNDWMNQPEGKKIIPTALHLTPEQFNALKGFLGVE